MDMRWFRLSWWSYLLEKPNSDSTYFRSFICRALNHPAGVWYVNAHGLEPDYTCKNCGDDLG